METELRTSKSKKKKLPKKEQPTVVLFRRYRTGEVVALFPDIPFDDQGHVSSYSIVGEHAAADYEGVIADTLPASEPEYRTFLKLLKARRRTMPWVL
jgi:hypothetical protein